MLSREENAGRIARLQQKLLAGGLDGALLVQPVDVYYPKNGSWLISSR